MVNFLKFKKIYFIISGTLITLGLLSVIIWGFKFSIDFSGGTNIEYKINKNIASQEVKNILSKNKIAVLEYSQKNNIILVRARPVNEQTERVFRADLEKTGVTVTPLRFETVGPVIGKEAMNKTFVAAGIAIFAILLYMSFAFKGYTFALAAVLAMVHDFLVLLGVYAIASHFFGAEIDPLFVTAVLTTMSFSVHDTIVVFDKIREYRRTQGSSNIEYFANKALTETLVRSLNNSMTIVFMLLALVLLGGSTIRFFSLALLIGTITGTYSSPFIATPLVVWLEKKRVRKNSR